MSRNEVGMIMSQKNVLERASSFFDKFFENNVIISWVNDVAFFLRLNIVGEDSKVMNLKLGNVNSFFLLFSHNTHFDVHFSFLRGLLYQEILVKLYRKKYFFLHL